MLPVALEAWPSVGLTVDGEAVLGETKASVSSHRSSFSSNYLTQNFHTV